MSGLMQKNSSFVSIDRTRERELEEREKKKEKERKRQRERDREKERHRETQRDLERFGQCFSNFYSSPFYLHKS